MNDNNYNDNNKYDENSNNYNTSNDNNNYGAGSKMNDYSARNTSHYDNKDNGDWRGDENKRPSYLDDYRQDFYRAPYRQRDDSQKAHNYQAYQQQAPNQQAYSQGVYNQGAYSRQDPSPQGPGNQNEVRKLVREEIQRNYKPKGSWLRGLLLALFGSLIGAVAGIALVTTGALPIEMQAPKQEAAVVSQTPSKPLSLQDGATIENAVAEEAIPSIVGITTTLQGGGLDAFSSMTAPSQFMQAVGSGVIVSSDGYILTNAHVVENGQASKLTVRLADGDEEEAELLWHDQTLDLAIIKIDRTGLPAAKLADSSAVQVGDKAIAIGNPLGLDLQSTLTSGFVSGLERSITLMDGNIMDGLIQTDAAINSGNSGGALLNSRGEVIGINTARPEIADGIGFAIPINIAKPIIQKVIETGSYEPIYLGIMGYNVQIAWQFNSGDLPVEKGVVVHEVYAGSPAAKADIQPEDIIISIDDKPVESMNSLKSILVHYDLGDTATIKYYSGDEIIEKEIVFERFDLR